MAKVMDALGKQFGFGSEEYDDFVFCGRRFERQPDGAINIDMMEYTLADERDGVEAVPAGGRQDQLGRDQAARGLL
eukprot:5953677-Pyramimonas_sp.AAC.1